VRFNFTAGFEKSAFILPALRMGGRAISGLAGMAGRGIFGAGKALGRGTIRAASGNITKPLGAMDYVSAGLTGLGTAAGFGDRADKINQARMR
jgi:hypothetical protein